MTVKELNQIKAAAYASAESIPEVKDALIYGDCFIYEVSDFNNRQIVVVNHKTQMSDSTIKSVGLNPETATVNMLMRLNRSTKCAEF